MACATMPTIETTAPAALPQQADLGVLARKIRAEHAAAERAAFKGAEHARQAGIYLVAAQNEVQRSGGHRWLAWLAENVPGLHRNTAAEYMRVARNWDTIRAKCTRGVHLPLKEALKIIAEPWEVPASEDMTAEEARRLLEEATASLSPEERRELIEDMETRLEDEAAAEDGEQQAQREADLLEYCVRAVLRLKRRLAKLGPRGKPLLRVLSRLERLVEELEETPAVA